MKLGPTTPEIETQLLIIYALKQTLLPILSSPLPDLTHNPFLTIPNHHTPHLANP
jgi:hypothetical protein